MKAMCSSVWGEASAAVDFDPEGESVEKHARESKLCINKFEKATDF